MGSSVRDTDVVELAIHAGGNDRDEGMDLLSHGSSATDVFVS